jgi:hypothetical protein
MLTMLSDGLIEKRLFRKQQHNQKPMAMEIQILNYKTRRWVFHSVDKLLRKNCICTIHYNSRIGYTVEYECPVVYKVVKGRDEKGFEFLIRTDINEESRHYLKEGDVLLFELEDNDNVWFTCTTLNTVSEFLNRDYTLGKTAYGSLSTMLDEGLIKQHL